jgi:hypothetical protein
LAAATPTPAAEGVQAPTESQPSSTEPDSGPQIQPDQPRLAPENEDTLVPSESEAEPNAPDAAPALPAEEEMLPFQDAPPQPPSDTSNEPQLPGLPSTDMPLVPEEEPAAPSPPLEDAPPTMPDDNPFLDDPIQPESTPPSPMGVHEAPEPAPSVQTLGENKQGWRSPTQTQAPTFLPAQPIANSLLVEKQPDAESLVSAYAAEPLPRTESPRSLPPVPPEDNSESAAGPELLPPPVDEPHAKAVEHMLPSEAPARRNPLRMAQANAGREAVVPVASWSSSESASVVRSTSRRRNPLRDN